MEKLKEYIDRLDGFSDSEITLIKHGYNSDTFEVANRSGKYIAHVGNKRKDSGSSLEKATRSLRFLESRDVDFVPRIVQFDAESDILIETSVGENDILVPNMSDTQLDLFIQQLVRVHSFLWEDIKTFCDTHHFSRPEIQTAAESLRVFGTERFAIVMELCPEKTIIDWIEPRLREHRALTESLRTESEPWLQQGDIGGNIRATHTDIYLIDWEFSTFGFDHELAYIKIHSHPTDRQLAFMINRYAHYSRKAEDMLYAEIAMQEKITRVNDVIWAAMKWGQSMGSPEEVVKFKALTYSRMGLYEELQT